MQARVSQNDIVKETQNKQKKINIFPISGGKLSLSISALSDSIFYLEIYLCKKN